MSLGWQHSACAQTAMVRLSLDPFVPQQHGLQEYKALLE